MLSFAHVHARDYARRVAEHPEAEIRCIWDDDPERGKAAGEVWRVPVYTDIDAALNHPGVDAVVVTSVTKDHPWVYQAALAHKKHIYTEKVLTISLKDADEIVAAVRQAGVKFMISLPSHVISETLFMRQALDAGWLGQVTMMRARIAHAGGLDRWFKGASAWFGDAELAGGGAMFDLGCHVVDVMRWLLGKPKSVVAKMSNFSGNYPIDDNSAVVVEFESGALGVLECSWVQRRGPRPIEIYGTEGYVGRDPFGGMLLSSTQVEAEGVRGLIRVENLPPAQPHPMDQWISAILHDTPMTVTLDDARNLTELMEGMYIAAREGREYRF
jgi:predicted dehydrogenase